MSVTWKPSADRHGIAREDTLRAMMHHEVSAAIESEPGENIMVYIGYSRGRSGRYLAIIAAYFGPRTLEIIHVMPALQEQVATSANPEGLADRAERNELKIKPYTVCRDDASRAEVQQILMAATDTCTVEDAIRAGIGRPAVGIWRADSSVVCSRVSRALKDAVVEIMAAENRTESDVVREAVTAYITTRRVS